MVSFCRRNVEGTGASVMLLHRVLLLASTPGSLGTESDDRVGYLGDKVSVYIQERIECN